MGYYLLDNPPVRSQFRTQRRAKPTGLIVLHSAENSPDMSPPDLGAEGVARFIANRSDPGSYHLLCDSDSTIRLMPLSYEAFQDGTGTNPYAIAVSGAFKKHQWGDLPKSWQDNCVEQMARACLEASEWLWREHGIGVPFVWLSAREARSGVSGFITHAQLDPGRRSDPGDECAERVILRYGQLVDPPKEEEMQRAPALVWVSGQKWVGAGYWAFWRDEKTNECMVAAGGKKWSLGGQFMSEITAENHPTDPGAIFICGVSLSGTPYAKVIYPGTPPGDPPDTDWFPLG